MGGSGFVRCSALHFAGTLALGDLVSRKRCHVAKQQDNFLKGLCRQLREAIDDGRELAYEFAELVDEALGLIQPDEQSDDGDDGGEVEFTDDRAGELLGETPARSVDGSQQGDLPSVPGLVGRHDPVQVGDDSPRGVPRGTRSGTPAELMMFRGSQRDTLASIPVGMRKVKGPDGA
jgi:hypothetical protein